MAEVYRQNGFVFHIYPNDHTPSHVHVFKEDKEVVINIGSTGKNKTPPSFAKRKRKTRMSNRDAIRAFSIVAQQQEFLLHKWREIHE